MRSGVQLGLVAASVLAAGATVYVVAFPATPAPRVTVPQAEPPPPAPPPPPPVSDAAFVLGEMMGVVEVQRGGEWSPAKAGDRLSVRDGIRTGDFALARLRDAAGAELLLRENVQLQVKELSDGVTALTLQSGKVRAAAARGGAGRFEIESGDARAVAAAGGRFTVYADPHGAVAVAADEGGDVKVIAHGREVAVPPKQVSIVEKGKPPAKPVAIPDDLFLAVAWPEKETRVARVSVSGQVTPGTVVRVNGHPAKVAADGKFVATVPLAAGKNQVEVSAEDMAGQKKMIVGQVTVKQLGVNADPSRMFDPPAKEERK